LTLFLFFDFFLCANGFTPQRHGGSSGLVRRCVGWASQNRIVVRLGRSGCEPVHILFKTFRSYEPAPADVDLDELALIDKVIDGGSADTA
jgi:hypothetical protein